MCFEEEEEEEDEEEKDFFVFKFRRGIGGKQEIIYVCVCVFLNTKNKNIF